MADTVSFPRPQFSGHETFPMRAGWPKKAYDAAREDGRIFGKDEALGRLGVGKNMVRSLKHWAEACGVLASAGGTAVPTPLGDFLLADDGADPFLEDPATAWLLHWRLCRLPAPATLWHFIFGVWHGTALDAPRVAEALGLWLAKQDVAAPSESTIHRDLQCLTGSYLPPRTARGDVEDALACPLAALGLLALTGSGVQRRPAGPRPLPPWVFAHAVLDFWTRAAPGLATLPIADVLYAAGSPGRVFGLSEDALFSLLDRLGAEAAPPFSFRDTAGIRQLHRAEPVMTPESALARHYGQL